jgi:hypothetical protein
MYEAGKYSKAIRSFEQIAPYREKPQAEKLFMFSVLLKTNNIIYQDISLKVLFRIS